MVFSIPVPAGMSQQTIELYAVKLAVKKSISLGLHLASLGTVNDCSCFLISDSTSSLHSILKLSTKAKFNVRGKVLRQISASIASCHPHSFCAIIGYIRSSMNPADIPSRWLCNSSSFLSLPLHGPLLAMVGAALAAISWDF